MVTMESAGEKMTEEIEQPKKKRKAKKLPVAVELDELVKNPCCICGGNESIRNVGKKGKYYCGKHRAQLRNHGRILERTRFTPNNIIDKGTYCEMEIYNEKNEVSAICLIDKEDVDKIKNFKWHKKKNVYVCKTLGNKKEIRIHRLILGLPTSNEGLDGDHINGDKFDNRKSNLRIVTRSQNLMNRKGVKGFCFDNYYKKWLAYITVNKKVMRLGAFKTPEEAEKARLEAEIKHFGEFSPRVVQGVATI